MTDWNDRQQEEVDEHDGEVRFRFLFVLIMTLVFFMLLAIVL